MTAIAWTVVDPDTIERLIAVGLCRRFTHARRVKASTGDGGLDVLVPVGGGSQMVVENYQVKKYADGLNSSRKNKIKESLKKAIATHNDAESGYEIVKWHLTLPMDLTREQENWLVELADQLEAPFPVHVFGLTQIEELLSGAPEIREYYLGDGLARLEAAIARLGHLKDLKELASDSQSPTPSDATESLRKLHKTINELDPHFAYDYEVSENKPQLGGAPGRIASIVDWNGPGTPYVTWHIVAKYDSALDDRPIPGKFSIDKSKLTPEQRDEVQRWHDYGTPVTIQGNGVAEFEFDLPGGLGETHPQTIEAVIIGAAEDPAGVPTGRSVWVIEDSTGTPVAELLLELELLGLGPGGGAHHRGTDQDKFLKVDLYAKPDGPDTGSLEAKVTLEPSRWVGQPVQRVLPTLKFVGSWVDGNHLRPQDEFGFNVSPESVPLKGSERIHPALIRAVEHLAAISSALKAPATMPANPAQLIAIEAHLRLVADTLKGAEPAVRIEGLVVWYEDAPGAFEDLAGQAVAGNLEVPWQVRLPPLGENSLLELIVSVTGEFTMEPEKPTANDSDAKKAVRVVPTSTTQMRMRWAGNPPVASEPS